MVHPGFHLTGGSSCLGRRVAEWVAPLVILLTLTGCVPKDIHPSMQRVSIFKWAGVDQYLEVKRPEFCSDPEERTCAIGFELYKSELYQEARECFERLLATAHRPIATYMLGVLAAHQADWPQAEGYLTEACDLADGTGFWTDPGRPRRALIWMLCARGSLKAAEENATELTRVDDTDHEEAWRIVAEVRRQQTVSNRWHIARASLVGVVSCTAALGISGMCARSWLYRLHLIRGFRRRLRDQFKGQLTELDDARGALAAEIAARDVATTLHEHLVQNRLDAQKQAQKAVDEVTLKYAKGLRTIDGLRLPSSRKQERRKALETQLTRSLSAIAPYFQGQKHAPRT